MADTTNKSSAKGAGTALLVGMAVGAAGMYLKDKKNQEKVAKKLEEIKAWSNKNMGELKDKAEDTGEKVVKMKNDLEDTMEDEKDIIDDQRPTKTLN